MTVKVLFQLCLPNSRDERRGQPLGSSTRSPEGTQHYSGSTRIRVLKTAFLGNGGRKAATIFSSIPSFGDSRQARRCRTGFCC